MSNLWKISHLRKCQPAPVSPKQCQYWQQWKGRSKTWKVSWVRVNIIRIINNVITFWVHYRGFGQMHFDQGLFKITSQCYPLKLAVFPAGISDICMTTALRNLLCWNLYSIFKNKHFEINWPKFFSVFLSENLPSWHLPSNHASKISCIQILSKESNERWTMSSV